jgi:hypothetical protein
MTCLLLSSELYVSALVAVSQSEETHISGGTVP